MALQDRIEALVADKEGVLLTENPGFAFKDPVPALFDLLVDIGIEDHQAK